MQWEQLTPAHITWHSDVEIANDGEFVYLRNRNDPENQLIIPISEWGGYSAGNRVGLSPECRSDSESGMMSAEYMSAKLSAADSPALKLGWA